MSARDPAGAALDGRTAAARAVRDALTGRAFVLADLRWWRAGGQLTGREAALGMEIGQGAVRHLLTIEQVLAAVARVDPLQTRPQVRAILATAAYQVLWMDRIPPFAAVDQAVELARRLVGGRTPGMVNAVLRRLVGALAERRTRWERLNARQVRVGWDSACAFSTDVLPDARDLELHLSAATGMRPEYFTALAARFGAAAAEAVAWAAQAVPVTVLQRNTRRASAEAFETALREAFGSAVAFAQGAAFLGPHAALRESVPFADGLVFVQDTTAHAAARAVTAQPGERVLDLCAAPGGKSVALALAMNDTGEVLACDPAAERLARVAENVARLGLTCVRTRAIRDDGRLADVEPFDAALVDVPCSNTGVIARRPEARLGLTPAKLRSLVGVQQKLIRAAATHVRPGGRLVYSTCSIETKENEQVVRDFVDDEPGWRLEAEHLQLPSWGPGCADWCDGGYYARLLRK